MNDPKSAADCLAHCRDVLTSGEEQLAVALIEIYAQKRLIECRAAFVRAWEKPITAAEAAQAEETQS